MKHQNIQSQKQTLYVQNFNTIDMTTKTIKVTHEAYRLLKGYKQNKESFSNLIIRKLGKRVNLLEFAGTISEKTANAMKEQIKEDRKRSLKRMKKLEAMWKK